MEVILLMTSISLKRSTNLLIPGFNLKMGFPKSTKLLLTSLVVVTLASLSNAKPVDAMSQAEIRASLITKHNVKEFLESGRKQKQLSDAKLPAPFVVTTSLNIAGRRHTHLFPFLI